MRRVSRTLSFGPFFAISGFTLRHPLLFAAVTAALLAAPGTAFAQAAAQPSSQTSATRSNAMLDSLAAPIALYPDALLAQVLMASTYPADVEAAAAWSKAHASATGDNAVKAVASTSWDPSVQSLVAFPQVLATMASKPDWMTQLGSAFIAQPAAVMDSVQRLRRAAQAAGSLKSSGQQTVTVEQNIIQIQPASPQVVYVPTYDPGIVYGAWPYPAYPPAYVPPPPGYAFASGLAAGIGFGIGIAITNSLWGGFNWNTHDVNINVNRYNTINVNRRIDVNGGTARWNRHEGTFSGSQRESAQRTLQTRTGQNLGGTAGERVQGIRHGDAHRAGGSGHGVVNGNEHLHRGADGDAMRGNETRHGTVSGPVLKRPAGERAGEGGIGRSDRMPGEGIGQRLHFERRP